VKVKTKEQRQQRSTKIIWLQQDADRFVCPVGHMAMSKGLPRQKNVGTNQIQTYYFDVENVRPVL
jgi:hypothetical protein